MTDNLYWLWLAINCKSSTGALLLDHFSHPHAIFSASENELRQVLQKHPKELSALLKKDLAPAHQLMDKCFLQHIGILPYGSPDYPPLLRQIAAPPILLYYRGKLLNLDKELCISVVGTRDMTEYGEKAAFDISRDIARAGGVVVSGLALGIDGVASAAALSAGGKTVAVLGSGVDRIYPKEHQKLYHQILQTGMVISEYPPGTPPQRHHFPERNRIISGLSQATLLIEGAERSGAMITARQALEQGRRVFAVPGNIDSPQSFSANYLIQNGAKAVVCADDLLEAFRVTHASRLHMERLLRKDRVNPKSILRSYGIKKRGDFGLGSIFRRKTPLFMEHADEIEDEEFELAPRREKSLSPIENHSEDDPQKGEKIPPSRVPQPSKEDKAAKMDPTTAKVYLALSDAPMTPDQISEKTGISLSKILPVLMVLEISGDILLLPGNRYQHTK